MRAAAAAQVVAVEVEQGGTSMHAHSLPFSSLARFAMRDNGHPAVRDNGSADVEGVVRVSVVRPATGRRKQHERGTQMAAMKPRTGDGPLEVTKEGRGIVMRVPLEGGGRLVVELTPDEATNLGDALKSAVG